MAQGGPTKTVKPIAIEYGIAPPIRWGEQTRQVIDACQRLRPGGSFVWTGKSINTVFRAARKTGVSITTAKVNGVGWRVWCREEKSKVSFVINPRKREYPGNL